VPELSEATPAGVDVRQLLKDPPEGERLGFFPAAFLRDVLLNDGPIILDSLFHQKAERGGDVFSPGLDVRRFGGDFDQSSEQGELVRGVFGFVAKDAQKILVNILRHGAIFNPWAFGWQG
jgi:hypothetical protein